MSITAAAQLRLIYTELTLQFRGGFYAAYTVMTLMFCILLALLPAAWRESGFTLLVLMDPAFMGFFFAGGLVLLEREQGVLPVIVTRGRGFASYWWAKVGAVLALAGLVVTVLATTATLLGFVQLSPGGMAYLAAGLGLTVPVFFSLGLVIAGWKPNIIAYFAYSGLVMFPLMFPFVEFAGVSVGVFGALSPVWGGMVLIGSMFAPARSALHLSLAVTSLVVWNLLSYRWAAVAFYRLAGVGAPAPTVPATPTPQRPGRWRLKTVFAADIRLMLRDRMTLLILLTPLLIAAVLGRGLPWLLGANGAGAGLLPAAVGAAVAPFMDNVRSFSLVLGVFMYGMVGAFLILDEKDSGVLPFLRTLPGRPGWFILRRGAMLWGLHAAILLPAVLLGGLYHAGALAFGVSLVVDALALPAMFMGVGLIAANKVQGLAVAKVLNVFTLPPILLIAIPERFAWLVGILPSAWGSLIRLSAANPTQLALAALIGVVYNGGLIVWLYRKLMRLSG